MTFSGLINAEYDFSAIGDWVKSVYEFIAADATVSGIWGTINSFLTAIPTIAVTSILLVLSLIEVFCGKKLLGLQKFLACFVVGFAVSAAYLPGILPEGIGVSPALIGLAVGIVAAILCKLVYFLAYVGVIGIGAYVMCYGGHSLPEAVSGFTKGNMMISLVVVVVVVIVALILKKLIEMVGTSVLGAFLAWLCIAELLTQFGLTPTEHSLEVVKLATIILLGLIGSIVQIRKRKRKW